MSDAGIVGALARGWGEDAMEVARLLAELGREEREARRVAEIAMAVLGPHLAVAWANYLIEQARLRAEIELRRAGR